MPISSQTGGDTNDGEVVVDDGGGGGTQNTYKADVFLFVSPCNPHVEWDSNRQAQPRTGLHIEDKRKMLACWKDVDIGGNKKRFKIPLKPKTRSGKPLKGMSFLVAVAHRTQGPKQVSQDVTILT